MIYKDRMTAKMEGDFVVFLIGMRINKPLAVHKYLPVLNAMPKMLTELYTKPELGLIHHEMWFSRTIILVQYWRSMEQLIDYAKNKDSAHLPAWQAFNKAVGTDGSVGIWHETYKVAPDKPQESSIHAGYRTIFGINIAWICSIKASNLAIPWHYARPPKRLIRTSFAKS